MIKLLRYKKVTVLFFLLFLVFLAISNDMLWKFMYPIKYQDEVKVSSEKYGIDPHLILAVIRVESSFDPYQESNRGAVGLMQIMPDTAKWIVEHKKESLTKLDQLHSPIINIDLGTWFLYALNKEFKGNWISTLAAYNAGPGNVNKWIKDGWEPSMDTIQDIPFGETRHYVQRVFYYLKKYKWIYEDEFVKLNKKESP
jgi:soluble lytic murein transglycosylase